MLLAGAVVAAVTAGIERWPRWGKEGKKEVSGRVGCTVRLPVFPLAWKAETSGSVAATGFARFFKNIYFVFDSQKVAIDSRFSYLCFRHRLVLL